MSVRRQRTSFGIVLATHDHRDCRAFPCTARRPTYNRVHELVRRPDSIRPIRSQTNRQGCTDGIGKREAPEKGEHPNAFTLSQTVNRSSNESGRARTVAVHLPHGYRAIRTGQILFPDILFFQKRNFIMKIQLYKYLACIFRDTRLFWDRIQFKLHPLEKCKLYADIF